MPSSDDNQDEDFANSREDQLLRAVAAAPRPSATNLLVRALPELAGTLSSHETGTRPPEAGDIVDGRYRIEQLLGSGGMGVVFAATHVATGRKVALKWLISRGLYRTQSERDAAVQRFLREAQAAGRIKHPNVVDVYDAGTDPSAPYLVMEKLEGETLRARMDRGRMDWDDALALLVPAMRGVSAAHAQGVVHRDLKPDNVFLARGADGSIVPKVLDFGVSRFHVPDATEPSLTRTGALIGTPAYMPLEQLRGEGNIDACTDVYALGVMLYEMLAGSRPYLARNPADFAALITSEPPTPLSQHRPELRGPREAAVMKALARTPGGRHASVDEFVRVLTEAAAEAPRPRWQVAGLALAIALAGGLVAMQRWAGEPVESGAKRRSTVLAHEPARPMTPAGPIAPQPVESKPEPPLLAPLPSRSASARMPAARPQRVVSEQPVRAVKTERVLSTELHSEDFTRASEPVAPAVKPAATPQKPALELGPEQF